MSPDRSELESGTLAEGKPELGISVQVSQGDGDGSVEGASERDNAAPDPLNWTQAKKNAFLFVISATAFLPDYSNATGAVTILPQAVQWGISTDTVNQATVGNVFVVGAGGIFVVILSAYLGRLPVLFWFTAIALGTIAWCAAATNFESFMTARILNGFFSTVAQAGGLMWIHDMFYLHEHPRKINIWSGSVIVSPYLGPFVAAFVIWKHTWPLAFWIATIVTGLVFIAIVIVMDETFYNRNIPADKRIPGKSRILRLIGVEQWRDRHQRSTLRQASMRPVIAIIKLPVLISTVYYGLIFAWVVGLNTTLSIFLTRLYHFGPKQIGLFYFTPMVAVILGELAGHWIHDRVALWYVRRHRGHLEPEARLYVIWLSTPCMVLGITLLGFALDRGYHYMVAAVAWGIYLFGIMIATVGLNAYNLDAYPEGSGEVGAWINFARTTGGFIITYFQVPWAEAMGTEKTLAIQAAIVFAASGLVLVLQIWGKDLRKWQGPMNFVTA